MEKKKQLVDMNIASTDDTEVMSSVFFNLSYLIFYEFIVIL